MKRTKKKEKVCDLPAGYLYHTEINRYMLNVYLCREIGGRYDDGTTMTASDLSSLIGGFFFQIHQSSRSQHHT